MIEIRSEWESVRECMNEIANAGGVPDEHEREVADGNRCESASENQQG